MNVSLTESAQNPEDSKRQLPLLNTDPLPSLPSPANPTADIGEQVAAKIALEIVAKRFKAINSKVIKSSLISYKEALQQLPEPVEEDHPLAKTQVRLVEISGTFQGRSRRLQQGVTTPPRTFTKAYIILRNADGFLLGTTLFDRGGRNRVPTETDNHDFHPKTTVAPYGINIQRLMSYFCILQNLR